MLTLQKRLPPVSLQVVLSSLLLQAEHLKHPLCHLKPPASFSSAAYTVLRQTPQLLDTSSYFLMTMLKFSWKEL